MGTTPLPQAWAWLGNEPGPPMLLESLKLYGVREMPGAADNPVIIGWARELGVTWYVHDVTAWCGLDMGIVAKRAGQKYYPEQLLKARNWAKWGVAVLTPMLGDILVFSRPGDPEAGHVGMYVAEDKEAYYVLGGNESDAHIIVRIAKSRLIAARRGIYDRPATNLRRVYVNADGKLSGNEA